MIQIKTMTAPNEEKLDSRVNKWLEEHSPHINMSNIDIKYQMYWHSNIIVHSAMIIYEK